MFTMRLPLYVVPIAALIVFTPTIWLLGHFTPLGYVLFYSKDFRYFYSGCLVVAVFLAVFLGIMSTDNLNLPNPSLVMLTMGMGTFFVLAFLGIFPAFFLTVPKNFVGRL